MSNIYQIFGTMILSLILLTGSLYAFAQDDDNEEKEEELEEEEQQQEESKEDEESDNDEKEEQEEQIITNETILETAQQIIQTELDKAGITSTNESQPVVNPPQEIVTTQAQPVANGMQFDATCNCSTPAKTISSEQQPIMQPTTISPTPNNNNVIEQIPITSSNIISSKSLGKVVDPAYTNYYTVSNLFDNVVNDISFWSQAGNSGFTVQLDQTLDGYQVCSIELSNIHNPKNVPYILDIGISKNYSGIIDQANERIQFDKCVKNMDQILMIFNSGNLISSDFISIGEIKLFGSKLGGTPPEQPPTSSSSSSPQEGEGPYKNATKINISNSEAAIDIKNSTITLKFDKDAAQATNYNVITIPDANVVK